MTAIKKHLLIRLFLQEGDQLSVRISPVPFRSAKRHFEKNAKEAVKEEPDK